MQGNTFSYGKGSLVSSENDMMATVLLSSLSQSLNEEDIMRYERLCQAAEHVELVPHALPKEHMVRDFTQWFHGWLVQNEEVMHRRERALATYEALTAEPIVMGAAGGSEADGEGVAGDHKNSIQALVVIEDRMPAHYGK